MIIIMEKDGEADCFVKGVCIAHTNIDDRGIGITFKPGGAGYEYEVIREMLELCRNRGYKSVRLTCGDAPVVADFIRNLSVVVGIDICPEGGWFCRLRY